MKNKITMEGNNTLGIHNIEPAHNFIIENPNGKKLEIDFSTDDVVLSGDLKYSEAAKLFFNAVNSYFKELIDKEVEKRLLELNKGE